MNLQETIYTKLSEDQALTDLLAEKELSIYNFKSPDEGTYPVIVFREVDEVPHHSDDEEYYSIYRFQVSILTLDGNFASIEKLIRKDLKELGFVRTLSTELMEGDVHCRILHFQIATKPSFSDES